jgi:hypothetical protein
MGTSELGCYLQMDEETTITETIAGLSGGYGDDFQPA